MYFRESHLSEQGTECFLDLADGMELDFELTVVEAL
jgi:hypothetical protein